MSIGSATWDRTRSSPSVTDDVDRGGTDVDAEEAGVPGDLHDRGPPAAAGRGQPGRLDQAELAEALELDGEPRPGQLDRVAQLRPGARPVVAEKPQQARLLRVVRSDDRHPTHLPDESATAYFWVI